MLKLARCTSICAFALLCLAGPATATESDEIQKHAKALFIANDFAALDKLATQYSTSRSRTSSGLWHLHAFNAGVSQAYRSEKQSEEYWSQMESKVNIWIAKFPTSALAPIVLGRIQIQHAYFYRGTGFSNTVTQRGWEQFGKYLAVARTTLEANKRISSTNPSWYETMLWVAQSQQWDDVTTTALFEEALKREPLYYATYYAAVDKLLPMWGGNLEKIESFADSAVVRTRQSERNGMHARIFLYAYQRIGKQLFENKSVWPKMKAGFEDVLKKYPDAWNKNNFGAYACRNYDIEVLRKILTEIGDQPDYEAWGNSKKYFDDCKFWATYRGTQSPVKN